MNAIINFIKEYISYSTCPKCKKGKLIPKWHSLECDNCDYWDAIVDERG